MIVHILSSIPSQRHVESEEGRGGRGREKGNLQALSLEKLGCLHCDASGCKRRSPSTASRPRA